MIRDTDGEASDVTGRSNKSNHTQILEGAVTTPKSCRTGALYATRFNRPLVPLRQLHLCGREEQSTTLLSSASRSYCYARTAWLRFRSYGLIHHTDSHPPDFTRGAVRFGEVVRGRHNYYATCPLGLWRLRVNRVQIQKHVEVPSPISRNGLYILALNPLHVSEATTAR